MVFPWQLPGQAIAILLSLTAASQQASAQHQLYHGCEQHDQAHRNCFVRGNRFGSSTPDAPMYAQPGPWYGYPPEMAILLMCSMIQPFFFRLESPQLCGHPYQSKCNSETPVQKIFPSSLEKLLLFAALNFSFTTPTYCILWANVWAHLLGAHDVICAFQASRCSVFAARAGQHLRRSAGAHI